MAAIAAMRIAAYRCHKRRIGIVRGFVSCRRGTPISAVFLHGLEAVPQHLLQSRRIRLTSQRPALTQSGYKLGRYFVVEFLASGSQSVGKGGYPHQMAGTSGHVFIETDLGDRRRRFSRLASVRAADRAGARRHLSRQLLHQPEIERRPFALAAEFRADPPRHHAADLPRGRRHLQSGLSRRARPLPVQSDQDHEDLGRRRDQCVGDGQTLPGEGPAGVDQRGLRRSGGPSATRSRIADRSTRSGRGRATTKANARPKRSSWTTIAATGSMFASCGSSTPTARECTRSTAAWSRISSARRCWAKTSRSSATAARPARSATATI